MNKIYKWLLFVVFLLVVVFCFRMEKAEAAQTVTVRVNGSLSDYDVYDIRELDWTSWLSTSGANNYSNPETLVDKIIDEFRYMIVLYRNNGLTYLFSDVLPQVDTSKSHDFYGDHIRASLRLYYSRDVRIDADWIDGALSVSSVVGCEDVDVFRSFDYFTQSLYYDGTQYCIGSTYDFLINVTDSVYDCVKSAVPRCNLTHPGVVIYPTVEEFFSLLPDELFSYHYFIVFRQDSPEAIEKNIVFYGWNNVNADLYISSVNSQICAMGKGGVLKDTITAYFDTRKNEWVIKDVVLGATGDNSFHVPIIYYSAVDLIVCDDSWSPTTQIVYMADMEFPDIGVQNPDSSSNDDGLINGFLSGIKSLFRYLFVPADGYFSKQISDIKSYFGFWVSICDTFEVFFDFLKKTDFNEPPKISINLSAANSKLNYGDSAYVLDMSWYAPYKESVDFIVSSILWLVFAYNTFRNLPNIISGSGSAVQASTSLMNDGKEH